MDWLREHWQTFLQSPHFWDWITLACGLVAVLGFLWGLVQLLGLPGRIAVARNHPDAEAVYAMGWIGFMAIVPWVQALIWAFKPTDKVDIRYLPQAERVAEQESLRNLTAYAYGKKAAPPARNADIDAAIDRDSNPSAVATDKPTAASVPTTPTTRPDKEHG